MYISCLVTITQALLKLGIRWPVCELSQDIYYFIIYYYYSIKSRQGRAKALSHTEKAQALITMVAQGGLPIYYKSRFSYDVFFLLMSEMFINLKNKNVKQVVD